MIVPNLIETDENREEGGHTHQVHRVEIETEDEEGIEIDHPRNMEMKRGKSKRSLKTNLNYKIQY